MSGKRVNGVWCTKDDVLQDLALATGGGMLDVDEHCLVYGERPPPRPECDIDDEMKILFGSKLGSEGDQKFVEPDLKGIMSMIRMVETEEENISPRAKPTDIIVISKLNPNVREFVPKSQASETGTLQTNKMTPSPLADEKTKNETPKSMTPSPLAEKKNSIESRTPIHTPSSSSQVEINSLKDKILSKTCKDPYKHRREKNAAIATLLRLCTTPPNTRHNLSPITKDHLSSMTKDNLSPMTKDNLSPMTKDNLSPIKKDNLSIITKDHLSLMTKDNLSPMAKDNLSPMTKDNHSPINKDNLSIITKDVKEKPIKLYTPEFFERCKASDFKGADDNSTEVDKNIEEPIKDTEIITRDTKETNDTEHTNLTPEVDKNLTLDEPTSSYELAEQQKSIAKVSEWLSGPKPQKTVNKPAILAGPIAYKRKEVMSPSSTTSATIDKKISKQDIKAYVPSNYATELRMKYEKNKKEAKKPINIWDNLEEQLKKKDEDIRKKSWADGL